VSQLATIGVEQLADTFLRVMAVTRRRMHPLWLEVDLRLPQIRAMMLVCERAPVHGRALARALGVGQPAVSKLVDRLVERGYVRREEDASDRRVVWLHPTERALELRERLAMANREAFMRLLRELSPRELETVARSWDILLGAAERLAARECAAAAEKIEPEDRTA
jgi:DNA-binding MarR family transcriptional regulator